MSVCVCVRCVCLPRSLHNARVCVLSTTMLYFSQDSITSSTFLVSTRERDEAGHFTTRYETRHNKGPITHTHTRSTHATLTHTTHNRNTPHCRHSTTTRAVRVRVAARSVQVCSSFVVEQSRVVVASSSRAAGSASLLLARHSIHR